MQAAVTVALVLGAACTYFPLDLHIGKAGVVAIILVFILVASLPLPAHTHSALYVFAASWIAMAFGHASAATGSFLSRWPSNWPDPFSSLVFTLSLFSAVAGSRTFFANVRPTTAISVAFAFVFFHPMGNDTLSYTEIFSAGLLLVALAPCLVVLVPPARLSRPLLRFLYLAIEPLLAVALGWLVAVPFQRVPFSWSLSYLWVYHLRFFALPATIAAVLLGISEAWKARGEQRSA